MRGICTSVSEKQNGRRLLVTAIRVGRQFCALTGRAFGKTSPLLSTLDSIALGWFATINVVTFLTFGYDKWRAGRSGQRVSELTLVMFGAIGGWPGGLIG